MDLALENLLESPPDIFNHNLETVPRLYLKVRPGSDYRWSLELIRKFKQKAPHVPTKSGLMLGLGEEITEVQAVLRDLHKHGCDMVTLGQYLQPSRAYLPVNRFVSPEEFQVLKVYAEKIGFKSVASGPLVRSSYHADLQASGKVMP
jgi:lipoic acid synthetase